MARSTLGVGWRELGHGVSFWTRVALTLIIALIIALGFLYLSVDPSCPEGTQYVLSETKWVCK